ncbi:MAG: DUF4013 domain-containing protein [Candidatus Theseobacter exili]|nr:DUF4013 domain-containing protein [Candidatus Theseobacter exili]
MIGNLTETVKFPFKDKSWILKVVIGGLLAWIPIVFFFSMGYTLNILKDAHEGKKATLPEWTGWEELFKKGFMFFIVFLAYGLAVAILAAIVKLLTFYGGFFAPIFSLLRILVGVGYLLLLPVVAIALCQYLDADNISAAFDIKKIINELKVRFSDYLIVSVLILGIYKVLETALGMNRFCSGAGITSAAGFQLVYLLYPFVMFILNLISARMLGEIYHAGISVKSSTKKTD